MMLVARQMGLGFSTFADDRCGDRLVFAPPNGGTGAHAQRVDQFLPGQPIAQGRVLAISSIPQHRPAWNPGLQCGFDLRAGHLVPGRGHGCLRHACSSAAFGIVRPLARQIQAVTHRQAARLRPQRQTDRNTTVTGLGLTRLINGALENTTATCVLVGSETYARPWVRYEIIKSVCRGNRVFAVHINQIKGKDRQTKTNGPNPFDYLALKYSTDGKMVKVFEAENGQWIAYAKLPSYTLKNTAAEHNWGKLFNLSGLGCKIYCWSADDGYNSFADWVG